MWFKKPHKRAGVLTNLLSQVDMNFPRDVEVEEAIEASLNNLLENALYLSQQGCTLMRITPLWWHIVCA